MMPRIGAQGHILLNSDLKKNLRIFHQIRIILSLKVPTNHLGNPSSSSAMSVIDQKLFQQQLILQRQLLNQQFQQQQSSQQNQQPKFQQQTNQQGIFSVMS